MKNKKNPDGGIRAEVVNISAKSILAKLEMVRQVGLGRWIARCPAHDDRNPSLSIRELDDGRVLLHCFAGCKTEDVLTSLGLGWGVLFPEERGRRNPRWRQKQRAEAALAKAWQRLREALLGEIADEIWRLEKILHFGGWQLLFDGDSPEWLVGYAHRFSLLDGVWRWLFENPALTIEELRIAWFLARRTKNETCTVYW